MIYDKVSWHWPKGENCPDLKSALEHFEVFMKWAKEKDLLSDVGKKAYSAKHTEDFELNHKMFTREGNKLIKAHYDTWLEYVFYTVPSDPELLDTIMSGKAPKEEKVNYEPICLYCKNLLPFPDDDNGFVCRAFPLGIPREIWIGVFDHTKNHPLDNGVRFESST